MAAQMASQCHLRAGIHADHMLGRSITSLERRGYGHCVAEYPGGGGRTCMCIHVFVDGLHTLPPTACTSTSRLQETHTACSFTELSEGFVDPVVVTTGLSLVNGVGDPALPNGGHFNQLVKESVDQQQLGRSQHRPKAGDASPRHCFYAHSEISSPHHFMNQRLWGNIKRDIPPGYWITKLIMKKEPPSSYKSKNSEPEHDR